MYSKYIWPPIKGQYISFKKPDSDKIFIGKVYKRIFNKDEYLVVLLNDNSYLDQELQNTKYNKKGLAILKNNYKWKQNNTPYIKSNNISDVNNIAKKYIEFKNNINQFGGNYEQPTIQSVIVPTQQPTIQSVIVPTQQPIIEPFEVTQEMMPVNELTETIYDQRPSNCSGVDDIKFDYILTENDDPDINNLFADDKTIFHITEKQFTQPDNNKRIELQKKLDFILPVNPNELGIVINASIAIDQVIRKKEDEINEGNKIIDWIKKQFNTKENEIIKGLKLFIHNGYVHILREGLGAVSIIPPKTGIRAGQDIVTYNNVDQLKYFNWQYGLPIDYDTLKYVLFQNQYQQTIQQNDEQLKEAKKILGLEYLVALQPEPKYVMWTVKRLIECWYADIDLQNSIRKIKVLINQYRAKGLEDYNKKHGVLPIIVVYPRYGLVNAEIVIKRLLYYFWKQIPAGWKCSKPTYFIQINNFMYYTNGAIDLKLYFRNVVENSDQTFPNIFSQKYTTINDSQRIENI